MFSVEDKEGTELNIKDEVSLVYEEKEQIGIVIALNSEDLIMVQLEEGAPVEVLGKSVRIEKSIIQDILSLKDDQELIDTLNGAERKYMEEVNKKSTRKKGASNSKPVVTGTLNLSF